MKNTEPLKAKFGRVQLGDRNFYVCEGIPGRFRGPWAILENNGNGMEPIVIREGISGSRDHAVKLMEKVISGFPERGAL